MTNTAKFVNFQDWLDACLDLGLTFNKLKDSANEYWFEALGYKVAYWDRKNKFGFISYDVIN